MSCRMFTIDFATDFDVIEDGLVKEPTLNVIPAPASAGVNIRQESIVCRVDPCLRRGDIEDSGFECTK